MLHERAAFANVLKLDLDAVAPEADATDAGSAVLPSCDELVDALQRAGATVVERQEHGTFLQARKHLIFVRRRSLVDRAELRDALQAAGVTPHELDELLAMGRRLSA
jgi:hypothetical protein